MAAIKEVWEWFVRHGSVLTGQLRDRESSFRKQYPNSAGDLAGKYNVFLKDDVPSENVFKKLFNSICFILNPNSTAFDKQQGLVQTATDSKVLNRDSTDNIQLDGLGDSGISQNTEVVVDSIKTLSTTNFATVVRPHQLPNIHCVDVDPDGDDRGQAPPEEANGLKIWETDTFLTGIHSGKVRKNFIIKVNVDNQSIKITNNKLETNGETTIMRVVTSISVSNGLVTDYTTSELTIVKGLITNIEVL